MPGPVRGSPWRAISRTEGPLTDLAITSDRGLRAVQRLDAFLAYLGEDFLGGPRLIKAAWVINVQKGGSFLFYAFLLHHYGNSTPVAWIYVAMQGAYGLVWLIKASTFPDPYWNKKVTFGGATMMFVLVLGWYWYLGWMIIEYNNTPVYPLPPAMWFCLSISLCIVGCAIMIAADAQKYFTLRIRRGLIDDGMFRYVRHPNYLGEMMVYGSFALIIWHHVAFLTLGAIWLVVFSTKMMMKEASLSRYPAWTEYKGRTWWLVPFVV